MTLGVCFLTGRSDRANSALSPAQQAFLDGLPLAPEERVGVNFPYLPASGPWRRTPLPVASARNVRDYFASRRPAFALMYSAAVRAVLTATDRTLVLAGSCGLELLANLELDDDALARVHVVAYGPVARSLPRAATVETVTGRSDALARRSTGAPDHEIDGHHLDYLSSPELRAVVVAAIARLRAEQDVRR
ncbi:hypothetical protein [Agromyces laixinhei]|uniref:hypothetical protein n=1 Tax=Agromyces laixinhei TaxID=2585717 RepID=UPI00143D985C|nr:hypothetical protein [Agromyces laixinhei]